MNHLELTAAIVERGTLRYSPAGIPILDCRLAHQSTQNEGGQERQVEVEVRAVGVGEIARRLEVASLGTPYLFHGFIARSSHRGKGMTYHMTEIELQGKD